MATGRPCNVCTHAERAEIDRALIARTDTLPALSARFGVSVKSLDRHRNAHVPTPAMQEGAQAVVAAEAGLGAGLAQDACSLKNKALDLLRQAEEAGDLKTALMGVREAARCLELVAKLTGDLDASPTVNLVLAPQFISIQTAILAALAPHPEARRAVVAALETVR